MEAGDDDFPSELSQRGSVSSSGLRVQDVLVYLVGERAVRLSVDGLTGVTAHELGRSVREVLHIPDSAQDTFAFWLCSPLLELQLKPKHQPYKLCRQWHDLLYRFTEASEEDISQDEPCLQFRRSVFYPKAKELQIEDESVLRLLYEEARENVLSCRYPCDPEHWRKLGALSCALQLGPGLDDEKAITALREKKLLSFLPAHVVGGSGGFLATLRGKGGRNTVLEQNLLEEYHKLTNNTQEEPVHYLRQYLSTCHMLPYYGCAFFSGEIDKPPQGILQRVGRKSVSIGISLEGVYIIDTKEKHVLLGLRFSELSWDHTYPEEEGDSHILWLEFDGEEDGTPVNKLLKVYSKQAELMSGLIEFCVELKNVSSVSSPHSDGDAAASLSPPAQPSRSGRTRDGQRGKLRRQTSVVCNRVHSLNTISYVDDGKEIRRLKPKRAASFFTRQASVPSYAAVQVAESLEQG